MSVVTALDTISCAWQAVHVLESASLRLRGRRFPTCEQQRLTIPLANIVLSVQFVVLPLWYVRINTGTDLLNVGTVQPEDHCL